MIGWRIYYAKAIENNWFTQHDKTPFESVFYSNFLDLCAFMSILNSKN